MKNRNVTFLVVCLFKSNLNFISKYFTCNCLGKEFVLSNLPQVQSNLSLLTISVTARRLTQFKPKVIATDFQKKAKIVMFDNYSSGLFIQVQIWY